MAQSITGSGTGLVAPHPTISNLWVREIDPTNNNLILTGIIKGGPDSTANVYSHGCLLTRVDGTTGATSVYENVGTSASPSWGDIVETTTSTSSSTSSSSSSSSSTSSSSSSSSS